MAKRKVNKSEEIRQYAGANPEASANEIVEALKKKRIDVTAQTVATVKSKAGLTKAGKGRRKKRKLKSGAMGKARAASNGHTFNYDVLADAKKLRVKAGSIELAIEAIRTIDRLESIS